MLRRYSLRYNTPQATSDASGNRCYFAEKMRCFIVRCFHIHLLRQFDSMDFFIVYGKWKKAQHLKDKSNFHVLENKIGIIQRMSWKSKVLVEPSLKWVRIIKIGKDRGIKEDKLIDKFVCFLFQKFCKTLKGIIDFISLEQMPC